MNLKKIKTFKTDMNNNSLILVSVLRDEKILLEYFIKYYKKKGITHFIFIDNGSKDGSFNYLKNLDENIMLFLTYDSYKDANYGVNWINTILKNYCNNYWCLVVDIDELIYVKNINNLRSRMKNKNSNVCRFLLLDMYSKEYKKYKKGENFIKHSDHFDNNSDKYYYTECSDSFADGQLGINGGVRSRICDIKDVSIIKRSFFLYNKSSFMELSCGYHFFKNGIIKEFPKIEFLLHFKFIKPNFKSFIKERINNNEDWDNSSEYKKYQYININKIYDTNYSIKLKNKSQLQMIFKNLI